MTTHMEFLIRQSRSADTIVASAADNCRFDERAVSKGGRGSMRLFPTS